MLDIVKASNAAGAAQPGLGAVRCLFGRPDPEETRLFQQTELRKIAEEQSHRWNYDFDEDRPLLGRYRWEPFPSAAAGEHDDSAGDQSADGRAGPLGGFPGHRRHRAARAEVAGRQARISDYFPKRKRLGGVIKPRSRSSEVCGSAGVVAVIRPQAVRATERQLPLSPALSASPSSSASSSLSRAQSDQ